MRDFVEFRAKAEQDIRNVGIPVFRADLPLVPEDEFVHKNYIPAANLDVINPVSFFKQ